jgi:sugar lactone lactonase YvrE
MSTHRVHHRSRGARRTARSGPRHRGVLVVLTALVASLLVGLPAGARAPAFPDSLPLPDGFYPEGITIGSGQDFFVGSLLDGALYRGDLRTGEGEVIAPGAAGRWLVGLDHDARSGLVWGAGIDAGAGAVLAFDAASGELVHVVAIPEAGFLNDLVVTRQALYVTDSFADRLYTVPLGAAGQPTGPATAVPLSGDFELVDEGALPLNLNGIDATPDGRWLVAVHSSLGVLYRIDPASGVATEIDLGGASVASGDGILLQGRTLYVVQNFLNQVAVVELDPGLTSGSVVDTIVSDGFRIPTTVARAGNRLYLVNARFDVAFPPGFGGTPVSIDYDVVQVRR